VAHLQNGHTLLELWLPAALLRLPARDGQERYCHGVDACALMSAFENDVQQEGDPMMRSSARRQLGTVVAVGSLIGGATMVVSGASAAPGGGAGVSGTSAAAFPGDNGRIVYSVYDGNAWDLYTINADGSRRRQLTDTTVSEYGGTGHPMEGESPTPCPTVTIPRFSRSGLTAAAVGN
jgi:hypothetical protein